MALTGCLLSLGCRASPAPDAGYLQNTKLLKADKEAPFNRLYVNPAYRDRSYSEVYVAPVNTDYLMAENIWEKAALANVNQADVRKNAALLAAYLRNAFIKACQNDPNHKFKPVDKPGSKTLILEMAIVQLVPSKSELQALGLVPVGYFGLISEGVMVGGSLLTHSEDQGKGVIAIEARTRDGSSGEIVSMFADREHPPTALLDIKALFWWESAKPICDGWARQFVELANHPKGGKIREIPNFQLLVW
jgi:hypothetical protein